MATVYVSYRSDDSSPALADIAEELRWHFGAANVKGEVTGATDAEYLATLERTIASADLVLALIGPRWLVATDDQGRRKIELPYDAVHIELATALQRGKPVRVLLFDGGSTPAANDLPHDIAALATQPVHEANDGNVVRAVNDLNKQFTVSQRHLNTRQINAMILLGGLAITLMAALPFYPLAVVAFLSTTFWGMHLAMQAGQRQWNILMLAPLLTMVIIIFLHIQIFTMRYSTDYLAFAVLPGLLICAGFEALILLAYALIRIAGHAD
jgi:hypothetical protein